MDCRKFQKSLEDYLQGDLDFPARFGMERHAQQCFACGKEVSDAQKLSQIAREFSRVTAPPDFEASVLARIHADKRRHSWWLGDFWVYGFSWPSRRTLVLSSSALALIIAGSLISLQSWIDPQPQLTAAGQSQDGPPASPGLAAPVALSQPARDSGIPSPVIEQIHQTPQQAVRSPLTRTGSGVSCRRAGAVSRCR
jgi:anti-sigma factor RsiW